MLSYDAFRSLTVLTPFYYACHVMLRLSRLVKFKDIGSLSGKFVDAINIFNSKRNAASMNMSGFAKIFHEQIDDIL